MTILKVLRAGVISVLGLAATTVQAESLTSVLTYAYENNPQIASSFYSVRAAGQAIRSAEAGRLPTIGAEANLGANWNNVTNSWSSSDSLGLGYNQTLFNNGRSDAAIQAAQARYDAAVFGARNTEQNVLLSVVQAYVNVSTHRRIVEIRRESIGFVEAQVQSARDRLELGEATQLDVSQAEASLAQATASYQGALNNLRVSEANFQRWVGRAPEALTGGYNFGGLLPSSLESALAQANTSHPALLASGAQLRAAQFSYDETMAGFGPNLSFSGNVGASGFTGDGGIGTQASVGLRLSVPIFTPTRDPSLEQANIAQIQSQLDGFSTRDQVIESVRQGWSGLQAATAQIESATAAVAASRLALQAIVDQNELGLSTTLDVLNQRSSLASSEEGLINAQAQRTIAAYSLIAATGALNVQMLGLPVQPRTAEGELVVPAATTVAPATKDAWGNLR